MPVIMMMGACWLGGVERIRRVSSMPSITGMATSIMIPSNLSEVTIMAASRLSDEVRTSTPKGSTMVLISRQISGSSSTRRIFIPIGSYRSSHFTRLTNSLSPSWE